MITIKGIVVGQRSFGVKDQNGKQRVKHVFQVGSEHMAKPAEVSSFTPRKFGDKFEGIVEISEYKGQKYINEVEK